MKKSCEESSHLWVVVDGGDVLLEDAVADDVGDAAAHHV